MRGSSDPQLAMLTSVSTEDLIPVDHPIRRIRVVVDAVLGELDPVFDQMYAAGGRASVPPETLLKSTVLMAMYSIRSERAFCERLNYDLLFKWFLDMRIDQPAFDATTFTKNRQRLLTHEVADEFFAAVVRQAKVTAYGPCKWKRPELPCRGPVKTKQGGSGNEESTAVRARSRGTRSAAARWGRRQDQHHLGARRRRDATRHPAAARGRAIGLLGWPGPL